MTCDFTNFSTEQFLNIHIENPDQYFEFPAAVLFRRWLQCFQTQIHHYFDLSRFVAKFLPTFCA